jgi:uncharacterized membrane protein YgcG
MSSNRTNSGGGGGGWAILGVILLLAAVFWLLSTVGHFLGLTPTWSEITEKPDGWVGEHYSGVFIGYVLTVLVLAIAALLVWFAMAAAATDEALKATAIRRLRPTGYAAITMAVAIIALPIGAKDGPAPTTASTRQASSEVPDDYNSAGYTSSFESEQAAADRRERRRAKRAKAKREERRERQRQREGAKRRSHERDEAASSNACHPSYSPCVPPGPPDLDCSDVDGPISVSGDDPHGLDRDRDGVGCETDSGGSSSSSGGGSSSSSGSGPSTTNWCGKRDGDGDGIYCE